MTIRRDLEESSNTLDMPSLPFKAGPQKRGIMRRTTRMAVMIVVLGFILNPIGAAARDYTLEFYNDSDHKGVAMIYQQPSNLNLSSASVAWQAVKVRSGKNTTFQWSDDFRVSHSNTHEITIGSIYEPTVTLSVDYAPGVQVTLSGDGVFSQTGQGGLVPEGSIQVVTPIGPYSLVGFGSSGKPFLLVEIAPYMQWTYKPTFTYRVAFGNYSEGMVLNTDLISDSIEVPYSWPTTNHVVRLNADGTMVVSE
ncbi:MAG: hypothetical protein GY780_06110 [bacterium]|nr:hypothetical protein [bacterium]